MDYDIDLQVIHTALLKADNLRNYKKLTNRGGNEEDFDNVVKIIQDVLVEKKFMNSGGSINPTYTDVMRRTTFFLILNSDISILHKIVNSDDLEHLIWKAPEIPQCLLIHIIWKLNLDVFFCEIIQYSSQDLALELLDVAKDNMKYTKPEDSITKVNMLITAAYESINRMFMNMNKVKYEKYTLIKFFETISYLLKFLTPEPPNKQKMSGWKKKKRVEHEGLTLCSIMDLMYKCFLIFISDSKEIPAECEMYKYTFCGVLDLSITEKKDDISEIINHYLNKINQLLTYTFKEAFQIVTVDTLCSWFEIEIKDSLTLQGVVGQKAYMLERLIANDDAFDKELVFMLLGISQKPKPLSEVIDEADYKTIYENASKPCPEQKYWIEALVRNKCFFNDAMLINFVKDNMNLVSLEDVNYLFDSGYELLQVMNSSDTGLDNLKVLMIKCLEAMPEERQRKITFDIVDKKPANIMLQLPDYSTSLTSYLNKVVELQENHTEMYSLFIQNPSEFYERCFQIGVCDFKQAVAVMNIFRKLKLCSEPLIHIKNKLTMYHRDMTRCGFLQLAFMSIQKVKRESLSSEAEKQSFLFLLENMINNNIIDVHILLSLEISPKILMTLSAKEFSLCLVYLQAMDCIFVPQYIVKALILIGLVVEKARWDLWTYSASAAILVNVGIKLAKKYLNTFMDIYKPLHSEYTAMCRSLNFLTPLNRYHFYVLWGLPFETQQYIPTGVFKTDVIQLSLVLHRMTTNETKELYKSLCQKYSVFQSLHLLCRTLSTSGRIVDHIESDTSVAQACLLYTCRNVALVFQECMAADSFLPSVINILVLIIQLINSRVSSRQEETLDCFLTILSQVLGVVKQEPEVLKMVLFNHPLENEQCRKMLYKIVDT